MFFENLKLFRFLDPHHHKIYPFDKYSFMTRLFCKSPWISPIQNSHLYHKISVELMRDDLRAGSKLRPKVRFGSCAIAYSCELWTTCGRHRSPTDPYNQQHLIHDTPCRYAFCPWLLASVADFY